MKFAPASLFMPLFLVACTPPSAPKPLTGYSYGPWQTLPGSCRVRGIAPDFTLTTTGEVENDTLYMELTFNQPLPLPPTAEITGLPVPIKVEGKAAHYTLQIPFLPPTAAHLMQPNVYLLISYLPGHSPDTFESSLPTSLLTQALAELGARCP